MTRCGGLAEWIPLLLRELPLVSFSELRFAACPGLLAGRVPLFAGRLCGGRVGQE